jgi:UDP-N-acetylglucosamine--N-acetylmuramyl-(pentapeptide) pyrophosphoryl-undecaprenol N-acetylglucosamine transferase
MSVPICLAAKILNIKIYLFEPNMVIGRANKFLLRFCKKLFCYSNEIINFPKKCKDKIFVINHILRKEIYDFNNFNKEEINNSTILLIVGGSQGAKFFDQNLKNSIINISKKYRLKIYHQISSSNSVDLEFFYKEHGIENVLFNFEDNIFNYINESNLAITRAGASTLSELAFLKVPFVAIPYKFATDNHQLENALYYEKYGCCWILKEEEFSQNKLTTLLLNIIQNKEDYLRKKKSLENFCYQNNWNDINEKLITCLNEN